MSMDMSWKINLKLRGGKAGSRAYASCGHLAVMYSQGLGVNVDIAEDVKWYKLAAEQGNAKAQSNLRAIYEQGQSIAPRPC